MDKYVRVDWPESQRWLEKDGVFGCPFDAEFSQYCVFVPEELYDQVNNG